MSKEQKFHKWIEEQDREEKDRVWQMILQKEAERGIAPVQQPKKARFRWNKWATAITTSLAAVAAGAVCLVVLLPENTPDDGENDNRYFTSETYQLVETENNQTLKDIAEETGKPLLYYDWYDGVTEQTLIYQVGEGETAEIVGYQERLMDPEMGYMVNLNITDNETQLDAFDYDATLFEEEMIQGVKTNWYIYKDTSVAYFQYDGYKYFIKTDATDEEYILSLVETLLPN